MTPIRRLTVAKPAPDLDAPARIHFQWLLRLRWVAILGQALTIAAVQAFFGFQLSNNALFFVLGTEIASNVVGELWARRGRTIPEALPPVVLILDVAFLTVLLGLTGGAYNPFSFLYLIHVALGAATLSPRWAWTIVGATTLLYGSLFWLPTDHSAHAHDHQQFRMHLEGMWVAFTFAGLFIAYFVQRVTRALSERDRELARVRELASRHERLAALTTLAAGAAHELGTPLATIAVAARELARQPAPNPEFADDVRLILDQIARCRDILAELSDGSGESIGETPVRQTVEELVTTALLGLGSGADRVTIDLPASAAGVEIVIPPVATARALRSLIKNGLDASPDASRVTLSGRLSSGAVRIDVTDHGHGIEPAALDRLGEPFYTTKEPGSGMGLGLYLCRSVIAGVGGQLDIASQPGEGTTASISLPADGATA